MRQLYIHRIIRIISAFNAYELIVDLIIGETTYNSIEIVGLDIQLNKFYDNDFEVNVDSSVLSISELKSIIDQLEKLF